MVVDSEVDFEVELGSIPFLKCSAKLNLGVYEVLSEAANMAWRHKRFIIVAFSFNYNVLLLSKYLTPKETQYILLNVRTLRIIKGAESVFCNTLLSLIDFK